MFDIYILIRKKVFSSTKKKKAVLQYSTVLYIKNKQTLKRDASCTVFPVFFSFGNHLPQMSFHIELTGQQADYVPESLDLTLVESDTAEGLGGTSGLRYLKPVRGSEP